MSKSAFGKTAKYGTRVAGCSFIGCITPTLVIMFLVVTILAAAGDFLGWLFAGGAPDQAVASGARGIPDRSPATTIFLWTPTPIPDECFVKHTPESVIVTPTPGGSGSTPDVPITIWIPTPTPCPPPPNNFATPDPRWTPVPQGYGPHGSPFRAGYLVTQEYGCTDFPEFQDRECSQSSGGRRPWFHRGFDIVSRGDPTVYSTIDGRVEFAGWGNDGFGNRVYVRSGDFLVIYPHLSRVLTVVGQEVRWGQPVGVEGSTGYSTGSHLHYQIEINGHWVDPVPYLNRE